MTALFGLPENVLFCKKCVISNQRPSSTVEFQNRERDKKETINFGDDGICDACKFAESKENEINWENRNQDLLDLCDKFRRPSGYDVVIPGSGGKDSAFTAHILKYKYGMNPLTVTWAPHLYTEIGWENFVNWSHVGGFDNILFTPNGRLHRKLTQNAFLNLLHPFQPFIIGQRIIGPLFAQKFGIDLVFYGENQAEYGNNVKENVTPTMNARFFSNHQGIQDIFLGGNSIDSYLESTEFRLNEFAPYMPLESSTTPPEVHYLGYYLKWDPQECYYYAAENTGFKANTERTQGSYSKYSSIDDKVDPFHYYTTLIKFGLGRATYDAAQEIRNGKITREEGIELVKKYDQEFPTKYVREFLSYIDISESDFYQTLDKFRSPHLWRKKSGEWELYKTVWLED